MNFLVTRVLSLLIIELTLLYAQGMVYIVFMIVCSIDSIPIDMILESSLISLVYPTEIYVE